MDETENKTLPSKKSFAGLTDFLVPITDIFDPTNTAEINVDSDPDCTNEMCNGDIVNYCLTCQDSNPSHFENGNEKEKGIAKTFKTFPICLKCLKQHHDRHELITKNAVTIDKYPLDIVVRLYIQLIGR